jgi:PAS domain S-box-containing protein
MQPADLVLSEPMRSMADATPVMLWFSGADALCTFFNKAWLEFRGRSLEQEAGNGWTEGVHPDDRQYCLDTYRTAFDARLSFEMKYRLQRADGAFRWVLDKGSPWTEQEGFRGYVGSTVETPEPEAPMGSEGHATRSLLPQNGEQFRLLVETVKDYAIFLLDTAGNIMTWNSGAERIKGYKANEIMGKHFSSFYTAEDKEQGKPGKGLEIAAAQGRCEDEGWRLRKDGSKLWANVVITALRDEAGRLTGFAKITRDLTERKQLEEGRRKRSEALLAAVLDNVLDGVIGINDRGIIESFNAAAERDFGYKEAEVIGQNIKMLMPEPYHSELDGYLDNYLRSGKAKIIGIGRQVVARRKDGSTFPIDLAVSEFFLEGQRHFTGVVRDLTSLQQSEEHQARLIAVLEATPDFVGIADAKLHPLFVNRAGRNMIGIGEVEDLSRTHVSDYFTEEVGRFILNEVVPTSIKTGVWVGETALLTRSGSEIPVSMVAIAHKDAAGEVKFLSKIMRDLTDVKKLEEQVRQAQKMDAVGQLAGGVAHDFNNLLTIISGYSDILLAMLPANDPKRSSLKAISEAGERAAGLTRQLLAFSRQTVLEPQVLDLNGVVKDAEKMLRRMIGEDILLTTVLDPSIRRAKVDPGQMGQVLMNLAVNARDAMPQGGKLTIETKNVELDEAYINTHVEVQAGRYVLLTVSDTGNGMPPEIKARIFEPFFTTKGVGKGTGLGLSVVHGIVKQSNGNIGVYSEVGVGTTFKVYLPAVEDEVAPLTSAFDPTKLGRGSETVLLVEDEDGVREIALLTLQTYGYNVLSAASGKEALRVVSKHKGGIDILVTDVVMPEMSGRQLAEALRPQFPQMKVLYLSGYTDDAVVRHGILQAEVAFLQKPYTPIVLHRKVKQVLEGNK